MRISILAATVSLLLPTAAVSGDDSPAVLAKRLQPLIDAVLARHVEAPTRQQLILAGTRAVYRAARKNAPQETSRRVSQISTEADLVAFLKELGNGVKWSKKFDAVFVDGVLSSLPGGGRLISAEDLKVQGQLSANRYVGTGVVLSRNRKVGRPSFPKVFYNGPAWKAGAKNGDVILEIDGKDSEKMSIQQVVRLLRGEIGSVVVVKVRQPESKTVRTLKITRGVAFIPTVDGYKQLSEAKWQYAVDAAPKLAYVRINRIGSSTLHELRQVDRAVRAKRFRGVILDLRYGGGTLHDIVMIADALLERGTIGRVRTGDTIKTYDSAAGSSLFAKLPMTVLVDRVTSSGREFLAAALRDNGRAVVVGEPTPGDGNVRSVVKIPGWDAAVIMATGELQRADGTSLRAVGRPPLVVPPVTNRTGKREAHRPGGVMPDHGVRVDSKTRFALMRTYSHTSPGLRKSAADPVIAKAVEALNAKLNRVGAKAKPKNSKTEG